MPKNKTLLRVFFYLWNLWPLFLGAGITVSWISKDLMLARIKLKALPWTRNLVGTQFGGSIYSMTDLIYMSMLIVQLGTEYIIWDKAASIRFKKPRKSALIAEFQIVAADVQNVKDTLEGQPKMDWERVVLVKDMAGEIIAEIHKIIHISKRLPTTL